MINKKEDIEDQERNEFELIEFTVENKHFGINVNKVSEIMKYPTDITIMPNSNMFVEGVFKPRNEVITIINLTKYLNFGKSKNAERDIVIITNFNKIVSAFHVHSVEAIHRVLWQDIIKPDEAIYDGEYALTTGLLHLKNKLITILDFEKILGDINPSSVMKNKKSNENNKIKLDNKKSILVVEDSNFLMKLLTKSISDFGYTNIITASNGQEAWDKLAEIKKEGKREISCVLTDIEMPKINGYKLIKLIRAEAEYKDLPIIVFSSIITEEMKKKGQELGANEQVAKPDITKLIEILGKYVN